MGEHNARIGVRGQKVFESPKMSAGLQYPAVLHVERLHVLQLLQVEVVDV